MFGIRLTHLIRKRWQHAVVWAMIPLAVFNGRTLVGCDCMGHFEAVCHCGCCSEMQIGANQKPNTAGSSCCAHNASHHGDCSCSDRSEADSRCNSVNSDSVPNSSQRLNGHHCTSIALFEVTPGTVTASAAADEFQATAFALADFSLPLFFSQSDFGRTVPLETDPPPIDLVVTLHRLVI